MAQVVYILIIFSRILSATSGEVYQYFKENTQLSNKILEYNQTETIRSSSSIKCAGKCNRSCSFIGFNTLTNVCRVFKTCEQVNVVGKEDGWRYYIKNKIAKPTNCQALYEGGCITSGIFTIYPWDEFDKNFRHVEVFCDMETLHGGWTVIQRRISGDVDFNKTWTEYKNGFGNLNENFWIGNDVIHQLTRTETVTLYVAITLVSGETKYQVYQHFSVADVSDKFRLFLQGPTYGTLGDSITSAEFTGDIDRELPGMRFSTSDQDNDPDNNFNCAMNYRGGWWFNACYAAYLNGPWRASKWGWPWYPAVTSGVDIRGTVMMIKPN